MNQEIWKDIPGYEGKYQASSLGNIRGLVKKVTNQHGIFLRKNTTLTNLKAYKDKKGYLNVSIYENGISKTCKVHRLVCITFLENPENKPQVNHINGIKDDNRVENLEWCTNKENQKHSFEKLGRKGSMTGRLGKNNPHSKIILQYSKDGMLLGKFYGSGDASIKTGLSRGNILSCCLGTLKTCGGFVWKYDEV